MAKNYTALLENKNWEITKNVVLSGLKKDSLMYKNMNVVLENTRQAILADTMMQNISYLPKLTLPLVRRLFPKLISNFIVSTQPIDGPRGTVRFLDAYRERVDGSGEDNIYPWGPGDTTYSTPQTAATEVVLATGAANTATSFTGKLDNKYAEGTVFLELNSAADGTGTWSRIGMIDKGGHLHKMTALNVLGAVNPKTLEYVVSFVDAAPTKAVRFSYFKDIQKNIPFGSDKTYSTLKFDISQIPVEAKTRKLGASYSFEMIEDYKAEFGENFEDRMVDYMTTSILTEVDGEILSDLFGQAVHSDTWDAAMPGTWTRGINSWYETVMPKINKMSNKIYETTHVGGASFLVCSPQTATVFQSLQQYHSKGDAVDGMDIGTVNVGSIGANLNVFTSPLCPSGKILMGFKGKKPEETGYVYAPYIPITLHPITYAEGMPSILARSRYATVNLRPDYYGVLTVTNL